MFEVKSDGILLAKNPFVQIPSISWHRTTEELSAHILTAFRSKGPVGEEMIAILPALKPRYEAAPCIRYSETPPD